MELIKLMEQDVDTRNQPFFFLLPIIHPNEDHPFNSIEEISGLTSHSFGEKFNSTQERTGLTLIPQKMEIPKLQRGS